MRAKGSVFTRPVAWALSREMAASESTTVLTTPASPEQGAAVFRFVVTPPFGRERLDHPLATVAPNWQHARHQVP